MTFVITIVHILVNTMLHNPCHHNCPWQGLCSIVLTRIWTIVMTRTMANYDDICHGALWWQWLSRFAMKGIMEHCDDRGHGTLWWNSHGTLWWQEFWTIVMKRAMEHCDDTVMEHCDYRGHGALWIQRLWSIEMTGFMEHCDECDLGSLWWQVSWNLSSQFWMTTVITMPHDRCHLNSPWS